MSEDYKDEDTLRHLHFEEELTADQIADRLGCSPGTIHNHMKKNDIDYNPQIGKPWHDKDKLINYYHGKNYTLQEMADMWECSRTAVRNAMQNHGIDRKGRGTYGDLYEDEPWRDEQTLRKLYKEQGLLTKKIAKRLGCSRKTVNKWIREFGIERRDGGRERSLGHATNPVPLSTRRDGYERWTTRIFGDSESVYVHRLLAVSEHGFDAVAENDVHHRNSIPWDNRVENLAVLSKANHGKLHSDEYYGNA
ncbi:helix-turn-helix domain-containing protein [Halobacterium salinarum]|uniref:helix-turn-helix domain-containing protein n=1 Tax=Halobacterium salinarum TaxID=2242 RepID=UPI0025573034|nr:helix-turn-helix domain-containing protein [Halobacterium salinarum]MDL0133537.1 HTH domain-containing protein [Halobacterium salinarum]